MDKRLSRGAAAILMSVIAIIFVLPILWMVSGSFREQGEIFKYTALSYHLFIPVQWTLKNYKDLFLGTSTMLPFERYIGNTLLVAITVTAASLLFNSLAAFAFAKLRFPLKRVIYVAFLSTLVIPGEVMMLPGYLLVHDLGWVDSYKALIIPAIIQVFSVFLLVQFFSEIPRELLDSARIDGSSWFRVYRNIVLPSSVPALITLGLLTFLGQWDQYLWPLIVINDQNRQMVQVMIANFTSLQATQWGKIFAADTVCAIPILVLFMFLQKYYVQSITLSGVKG